MHSGVGLTDSYVGRKLTTGVLMVVVVMLAISMVKAAAYGDIVSLILTAAFVLVVVWCFLAREYWWVMLPATVSFGGFFYFGFRLMLYEIGLCLSLLPLMLSVATARGLSSVRRRPLSAAAMLLLAYLVGHMTVSLYMAYTRGLPELGTLMRVYVQGLWPLLFLFAFRRHGSTTILRQALLAMYVFAMARVILGAVAMAFPEVLYVPGINFVLPAATSRGTDLRFSALLLASCGLCLSAVTRSRLVRAVNIALAAGASVLMLFGGGRIGFLMYVLAVMMYLAVRRRYAVLAALTVSFAVLVTSLNMAPDTLYRMPPPVRRTLSCLVLESRFHTIHEEVVGSDEWHFQLTRRGRQRWLESPRSFFVGNRILPYSEDYGARSANFLSRVEIAVGMGAYESGLWTVLACTGAVGGALYAWLLVWLLRAPFAQLRRNGIPDYRHAFYFLAVSRVATWVLFCWIAGHFPADELMLAGIARAACDDDQAKAS